MTQALFVKNQRRGLDGNTDQRVGEFTWSPVNFGAANAGVIKPAGGLVKALQLENINAALRFFLIVNKATTPVGGGADDSLIVRYFSVPSNNTLYIDQEFLGSIGIDCSAGIAWAFSTSRNAIVLGVATDIFSTVGYV